LKVTWTIATPVRMRDKKLQISESTDSHLPNELQLKSKKRESGKRLTTTKGSEDNNMKPLWPLLSVMSLCSTLNTLAWSVRANLQVSHRAYGSLIALDQGAWRLEGISVTNTSLLGLVHVLAVRPWHTGCL
jgi:hypothetical protein